MPYKPIDDVSPSALHPGFMTSHTLVTLHTEADQEDLFHLTEGARKLGRDEEFLWREEPGPNDGGRESINSLIVMTSESFISGVKAQLIAFTYQSNHTVLRITTNIFLFVGMTLDVIGAATGVVSAILVF
ncbi:hypothetical protein JB92DRAFT_3146466 [Gautieria morchelliformis]|nr:hypothetical protein JB92DRAFT_3146466 [Gautieria morchelliformis]